MMNEYLRTKLKKYLKKPNLRDIQRTVTLVDQVRCVHSFDEFQETVFHAWFLLVQGEECKVVFYRKSEQFRPKISGWSIDNKFIAW